MSPADFQELLFRYLKTYALISLRYGLFAGALYVLFYVWKKQQLFRYKIQPSFPDTANVRREIGYSFLSLAIVAMMGTGLRILQQHGYSKLYSRLADHSLGYFALSVLSFIVIHDTYFYWTHRLLHCKLFYASVHRIHHLSTNPSPWAAFSFHPIEAIVQVGIVPLMAFLIPIHPLAMLAWIIYQTTMNVLGHLGFEFFPSGFVTGKITRWHNTATHHNMHHKYIGYNFGLYYNFWDRLMGTNHPRYEQEFELVKKRTADSTNQISSISKL